MKAVVAVVVAAVALAGAVWLHSYETTRDVQTTRAQGNGGRVYNFRRPFTTTVQEHPSWADPAALALAVLGLGFAGVLVFSGRSQSSGRAGSRAY